VGDGQDVIVLEVEGAAALNAVATVTLKDGTAQLGRGSNARGAAIFVVRAKHPGTISAC
jgi:hypothetical protein